MAIRFSNEEFERLKALLPVYDWGLRTLMTKLGIIHEDLSNFQKKGAIDFIHSRIKAPESIAQKLHEMGLDITAENAKKHLKDIAGARIICPFATDIYFLAGIIRSMPGVNILKEKDYISSPKRSGYRSYHLVVQIPVFFSGKTEDVTVEIQIRTEAMNFWATLEHKARYKYRGDIPQNLSDELATIADKIAELDHRMFTIHEIISMINEGNGHD
ncbi:MAG: GTP pyrophosphokinase family protein [Clostridiales bacterium]|jgi:putative GTP pyrophosphokinase|nr:GTP pyrophosphokinase family protein [Clostridiales bacterium]